MILLLALLHLLFLSAGDDRLAQAIHACHLAGAFHDVAVHVSPTEKILCSNSRNRDHVSGNDANRFLALARR
jgi:hypothetical protein